MGSPQTAFEKADDHHDQVGGGGGCIGIMPFEAENLLQKQSNRRRSSLRYYQIAKPQFLEILFPKESRFSLLHS